MAPRFHSPQYVGTGDTVDNGATDFGAENEAQEGNRTHAQCNLGGVSTVGLRSVPE